MSSKLLLIRIFFYWRNDFDNENCLLDINQSVLTQAWLYTYSFGAIQAMKQSPRCSYNTTPCRVSSAQQRIEVDFHLMSPTQSARHSGPRRGSGHCSDQPFPTREISAAVYRLSAFDVVQYLSHQCCLTSSCTGLAVALTSGS